MTQQIINVGSAINDGTGDQARTAFTKSNDNFTELYARNVPQCGRLEYVSPTALSFKPYGGNQIKINGVLYTIPAAGITAANTGVILNGTAGQNLVANNAYLVCLQAVAGVPTIGFYTTLAHVADTTAGNVGVEIATGNTALTVIGMVFANASAQFQDANPTRYVISWFNRRNIGFSGGNTGGSSTTGAAAFTAFGTSFLSWADEHVMVGATGSYVIASPGTGTVNVCLEAMTALGNTSNNQTIGNAGWWGYGASVAVTSVTDGVHTAYPMGNGGGVGAQFFIYAWGMTRG